MKRKEGEGKKERKEKFSKATEVIKEGKKKKKKVCPDHVFSRVMIVGGRYSRKPRPLPKPPRDQH